MKSPPKAEDATSSNSSNCSCNNASATATPPPFTAKSIPKTCDATPYLTTFVQADTTTFRQVVQILMGWTETAAAAAASANSMAPKGPSAPTGPKRPSFMLYERRNSLKNLKVLSPLVPTLLSSNPNSPVGGAGFFPPKQQEILSPSMLDFPSGA